MISGDDASWKSIGQHLGTCAYSPPFWCLAVWAHDFLYSEAKGLKCQEQTHSISSNLKLRHYIHVKIQIVW
jgi:hypothetical protein